MDLTPLRQLSDDALVTAAADGDERAFGELVRRHGDWLLSEAGKIAPDQAEDVVQAALMNAYRALRQGTRPVELERWLRTIVRNAAISGPRRARDSQPLDEVPAPWTTLDEDAERRGAAEGSVRLALHRARRRLRGAIPALFPLPGLDFARRALGRVRGLGPVGGAGAAGAVAATVAAVAVAGGLPGGSDREPGGLALAQVDGPTPGLLAPPRDRGEPREAGNRKRASRKHARRNDRGGKGSGGPQRRAGSKGAPGGQPTPSSSPATAASAPAPGPGTVPSTPSSPPASSPPPKAPQSPPPSSSSNPQPQPEPTPEPPPPSGSSCPGPVSCLVDGLLTPGK